MLKVLTLLSPIVFSLFWAIMLSSNRKNRSKSFLGYFMVMMFFLYLSHMFYYVPLPDIYHYFDIPYQALNLIIFPTFYIYILLLTVDESFSFKSHGRYFIFPGIFVFQYSIGVILMSKSEHIKYLYDMLSVDDMTNKVYMFQRFTYVSCRALFVVQGLFYSYRIVKQLYIHKEQIKQYYSGDESKRINYFLSLTIVIFLAIGGGVTLAILGKEHFLIEWTYLIGPSILFSSVIIVLGFMGYRQESFFIRKITVDEKYNHDYRFSSSVDWENVMYIKQQLKILFDEDEIYLDSNLTIWDLADKIKCNHDSVSYVFNNVFCETFSDYVSRYRVEYAKNLVKSGLVFSKDLIAKKSGFKSVSLMEDAVVHYKNYNNMINGYEYC